MTLAPRAFVSAVVLLSLAATPASAAIRRRRGPTHQGAGGASLRKRLHINSLITQEGTVEIETGANVLLSHDDSTGAFSLPTVVKWTPGWHTEYNVSFDGLAQLDNATHFSDRVTLGATHEFTGWNRLSLAAGPQLTMFTRGESGVRYGGVGLARVDLGVLDGGISASYSRANHPSDDNNPTGLLDLGAGFGHKLSARFTIHANYLYEKATGFSPQHSLYEGIEFQITPHFAVDTSVQQVGVGSAIVDHQLVVGLTMNMGRPGSWLARRH